MRAVGWWLDCAVRGPGAHTARRQARGDLDALDPLARAKGTEEPLGWIHGSRSAAACGKTRAWAPGTRSDLAAHAARSALKGNALTSRGRTVPAGTSRERSSSVRSAHRRAAHRRPARDPGRTDGREREHGEQAAATEPHEA